jgi:aspartyl-tRNA(Asn)/glutamyl-tRNA(Gln) amidotransferase subunit B
MKQEMLDKYEMTIGIECHAQLATATKLFSPADNDSRDREPNSTVHPIDFGLPGMLPVLNRQAVNLAIRAGKALNATVANVSRFDRKHYFYPDLPKGYQTTQMYQPIIGQGFVDAPLESGETVRVRIHHAHMEEDAGKLTHYSDYSLVDLNRAGTPLIEIVSEPDIHSAEAAKAFATELYRLMTYAGVTRGDLYHGNMRFDVNVSVALKGSDVLGRRAEVKNLNSFRSVEKAAEYEYGRQVELLEKGETIVQETRGWDDAKLITVSQRSKEDAQDYRYMPDADIPPIVLSDEEIHEIQNEVPMLPAEYREKWVSLQLDGSVTSTLLSNQAQAEIVTDIQGRYGDSHAKRLAHWFSSSVDQLSKDTPISDSIPTDFRINNDDLYELSKMVENDDVNSSAAKIIFNDLLHGEKNPRSIAESKNLLQESDEGAIIAIVDDVLADPASASSVADVRNGKEKAIGYLVGQVMKKSQGKANPALAQKLIKERLAS